MNYNNFLKRIEAVSVFFAALAILALLIGRFWWPGSGAAWTGFIRIFLLLVLVLSAVKFFMGPRVFPRSNLLLIFILFWVYLLINSLLISETGQSARRLVLLLAFVAGICALDENQDRYWKPFLMVSVLAGVGFAGFSLINKILVGEFSFSYRADSLFESGIPDVAYFGNTIVAGMNYAFCFIGAVWLILRAKNVKSIFLWAVCILILSAYLYFTYARTSWVAALMGASVLVLLMTAARLRKWILISGAVGFLLLVTFGLKAVIYELKVRGLTYRDEIWSTVISRMTDHWWFGHGAGVGVGEILFNGGTSTVKNTHSLYLEVLFQFGILGLMLMLLVMGLACYRLLKAHRDLAVFWLAILIAMSAVMLVELRAFVSTPNLVWVWFWLPVGGALALELRKKHA